MKKLFLFFALLCATAQGARAQANWDAVYAMTQTTAGNWTALEASTTGRTLGSAGNTTYWYANSNLSFTNSNAGGSGLTILGTVYLYVPEGVTVTCTGANANGQTGAGAGIELTSGNTLYLLGGGTVNATGGNAANGGTGGTGGDATGYNGDWTQTGAGGTGGYGGGGAGAGIGTRGGNGGSGGSGGGGYQYSDWNAHNGTDGSVGNAGSTAGAMGNLYVVTSFVHLNATGGNAGTSGGSGGQRGRGYAYDGYSYNYTVAGGGGGGAGGFGGAASNIGTGGPGGGGGGGGAGGAQDYRSNSSGGVYDVTAPGGKGGKNADGSSASDGTEAATNGTAHSQGWVTVDNGSFSSSDWHSASGDCSFGSGGSGGAKGGNSTAGTENNVIATDADGIYLIYSAADWNTFAAQVANGNTYSGKTLKLMADISVSAMVGGNNNSFQGTFDGDGHTLTFNKGTASEPITFACALFLITSGNATIQNLKVEGEIYTSATKASGLIYIVWGTTNIINCQIGIFIYSSHPNYSYHSGFVSSISTNYTVTVNITGCVFNGRFLTNNGSTYCGGFVQNGLNGDIHISNSLYAPSGSIPSGWTAINNGGTFVNQNAYDYHITNSYYTETLGTVQGKQLHSITPGTDVTVANAGNATEYNVTGITSYGTGIKYNDVLYAGNGDNVSLTLSSSRPGYFADVFEASAGTLSGSANPYTLTMPDENVTINATSWSQAIQPDGNGDYLISSTEDWEHFCSMMEQGYSFSGETVKLAADISVTTIAGSSTVNSFQGTFDGDGHILTFNKGTAESAFNEENCAPFRHTSNATFQNLTVTGDIYTAQKYAAGIVARPTGTTTITNCHVSTVIHSSVVNDDNNRGTHGGFVGVPSNTLNITGCIYNGRLLTTNGTTSCGGFVGWSGNSDVSVTVTNSLYAPNTGITPAVGETAINSGATFVRGGGTFTNCYYTETMGSAQGKQAYTITGGTSVTVANAGNATEYTVSGITSYVTGIKYNDVLYAGSGDAVSLTLGCSGFTASGYSASNGTLTGTTNPYTLTMPASNVTISAIPNDLTTDDSGNYLINDEDDWNAFCVHVEQGTVFNGATVKLMDDISVSMMAGTSAANSFQGTFLGNNKTLTFTKGTSSVAFGEQNCAPFRFVSGATIQDLTVAGDIYTSQKFAGGLVSRSYGTLNITNCRVGTVIHSSVDGDGTHGGLVAMPNGVTTLTITGCAYTGRLLTNNGTLYCGGFVGWYGGATIGVTSSLYAPSGSTPEGWTGIDNGATYVRGGSPTLTNCYYTETMGTAQGTQAYTTIPDNEISLTVTICDVTVYTICTISGIETSYPLLPVSITPTVTAPAGATNFTLGTGYTATLNGNAVAEMPITISTQGSHTLVLTGTGNYVGTKTYQFGADSPFNGDGTEQSPYIISSTSKWDAFCTLVANGTTFSGKYMKLDADISVSVKCGTVSGSTLGNAFSGTFDGNGHTITATITDNDNRGTALFCYINGATIKDLTVAGTITSNDWYAAGLVGFAEGTCSIQNCVATDTIHGRGYVGGIVGHALDGEISISGCLFNGLMTSGSNYAHTGVFIGWGNSGTRSVTNCLYIKQDGQWTNNDFDLVKGNGTLTMENCYKTANVGSQGSLVLTAAPDNGISKRITIAGITVYSFACTVGMGEYYVVNEPFTPTVTDPFNATLTLGTDYTATLDGDPVASWPITITEASDHTLTFTGIGNYQGSKTITLSPIVSSLEGSGTENAPYTIGNIGEWNYFVNSVNSGHSYSGEFVQLTANISVTTKCGTVSYDTPENAFSGTFDGNGKTITATLTDNDNQGTALFCYINGAIIQDLTVAGTIASNQYHAAGLVGFAKGTGNSILNCVVTATVNGSDYVGGIVGHAVNGDISISGCVFSGLMTGGGNYTGVFIGWGDSGTRSVTNCLYIMQDGQWTHSNFDLVKGNGTLTMEYCYKTANVGSQGSLVLTAAPDNEISKRITVAGITVYSLACTVSMNELYAINDSFTPTVTDPFNATLTFGTDYTATFDGDPVESMPVTITETGDHTLTLTGMGNYQGTKTITLSPMVSSLEGSGTENDPYTIGSIGEWIYFVNSVSDSNNYSGKFVQLTANISVSVKCGTVSGSTLGNAFSGTFDGNEHTITATITDNDNQGTALFCYINGATIKNLTVAGTITSDEYHAAGLVGFANGTNNNIENCVVTATVNGNDYVGGIVAHAVSGDISISGCVFSGLMTDGDEYQGAFIGWGDSGIRTVTNCLYLKANDQDTWRLDLVKGSGELTVENCYKTTSAGSYGKRARTVTAGDNVTIGNLIPMGNSTATYSLSGITAYGMGIIHGGTFYYGQGDQVSLTLSYTGNTPQGDPEPGYTYRYTAGAGILTGTNNPYTLTMPNADVTINYGLAPIDWASEYEGTAGDPYMIYNTAQLDLLATRVNCGISEYEGKYFKLANDIAYSHTTDWDDASSTENNYTAIGRYYYENERHYYYFRGDFDGDGHTISGIRIYNDDDDYEIGGHLGIFGLIGSGANIHGITLADARITGYDYTGGIVGYNDGGTITNCHVSATVDIHDIQSDAWSHGGIVGFNYSGTVSHCTSSATLTIDNFVENTYYGAICGQNYGTLSDNFAVGAIVPYADENSYGAICGYHYGGTLERNYYTACNVAGTANATGVGCGIEVDDDEYESVDITENDGAVPFLQIDEGKWYSVSSPVHTSGQTYESTASVNGLTTDAYDLLRYNESTATWENQKAGNDATGFTTLDRGTGYIYRRSDGKVLHFSGEPNLGTFDITLSAAGSGDLQGFNLIGNPYPYRVQLDWPFYSLNADGTWQAHESGEYISIGQAVLVYTNTDGQILHCTPNSIAAPSGAKGSLPPLPKGLCLSDDCGEDEPDAGRMPAVQGDFARWDGDQLVVTGEGTLQVYDVMGRMLFTQELPTYDLRLPTSEFPRTGVYILRLNGQTQKIVINK